MPVIETSSHRLLTVIGTAYADTSMQVNFYWIDVQFKG